MSGEMKLLPCPFCGGEARTNAEYRVYTVSCTKCQSWMGRFPYKNKAVKTWNTRTPPPAEKPGACKSCEGNGIYWDTNLVDMPIKCEECGGTGDLTPKGAWSTECDDCEGTGEAKKPERKPIRFTGTCRHGVPMGQRCAECGRRVTLKIPYRTTP